MSQGISYKMLQKIAPEVTEAVVRYAFQIYGGDPEWIKNIWKRFSFQSIARRYFREYVNHVEEVSSE